MRDEDLVRCRTVPTSKERSGGWRSMLPVKSSAMPSGRPSQAEVRTTLRLLGGPQSAHLRRPLGGRGQLQWGGADIPPAPTLARHWIPRDPRIEFPDYRG